MTAVKMSNSSNQETSMTTEEQEEKEELRVLRASALPCPFCGNNDVVAGIVHIFCGEDYGTVMCQSPGCSAEVRGPHGDGEKEAMARGIAAWNKRTAAGDK
jgi:transcription elongation factor Elf1